MCPFRGKTYFLSKHLIYDSPIKSMHFKHPICHDMAHMQSFIQLDKFGDRASVALTPHAHILTFKPTSFHPHQLFQTKLIFTSAILNYGTVDFHLFTESASWNSLLDSTTRQNLRSQYSSWIPPTESSGWTSNLWLQSNFRLHLNWKNSVFVHSSSSLTATGGFGGSNATVRFGLRWKSRKELQS